MRRTNTITKFHKNAPRKLIALYRKHNGNCYQVSKEIGVNASHVWKLLKNGVIPKRLDLREKLFVRVPKPRQKTETPEFMKEWYKLEKGERYKVIQQYLNWKKKNKELLDASR